MPRRYSISFGIFLRGGVEAEGWLKQGNFFESLENI